MMAAVAVECQHYAFYSAETVLISQWDSGLHPELTNDPVQF